MGLFRTLMRNADEIPTRRTTVPGNVHATRPTVGSSTLVNTSKPSSTTQIDFDNPTTIGSTSTSPTTTIDFNSVRSGADKYDVIDSPFFPKAPQKSQYTDLFDRDSLLNTQDNISKGNLYYGYGKESSNPLDRQLTYKDFQSQRPADEVFGRHVFQPSNKAPEDLLDPSNNESMAGYYDMDAAHAAALGDDDIARMIVENGKQRVLRRRLEYTHPKEQQDLDYTLRNIEGWGDQMPHYSSINVLSNTVGSGSNIVSDYIGNNGVIPVVFDSNPAGSRYNPYRNAIFMQQMTPHWIGGDKELALANDLPVLKGENGNYNFHPMDRPDQWTLDASTMYHEGIHAGANDTSLKTVIPDGKQFVFTPNSNSKSVKESLADGTFRWLLSGDTLSRANLLYSGIVPDVPGYAIQRADELVRAYAVMKDPVVNSIRHRVEQLAPQKIPDWANKTPAERNKIIADTVLDLSEDSRLIHKIISSWGGIKGDIRIPMDYIRINDPGYMYELLRAMDGIRKAHRGLQMYTPEEYKMVFKRSRNYAAKSQGEDVKNYNMNTWRKKILPQLMPAITAAAATPAVYSALQNGQENTYR